jgi:hypothetical protein
MCVNMMDEPLRTVEHRHRKIGCAVWQNAAGVATQVEQWIGHAEFFELRDATCIMLVSSRFHSIGIGQQVWIAVALGDCTQVLRLGDPLVAIALLDQKLLLLFVVRIGRLVEIIAPIVSRFVLIRTVPVFRQVVLVVGNMIAPRLFLAPMELLATAFGSLLPAPLRAAAAPFSATASETAALTTAAASLAAACVGGRGTNKRHHEHQATEE